MRGMNVGKKSTVYFCVFRMTLKRRLFLLNRTDHLVFIYYKPTGFSMKNEVSLLQCISE